jgi:hypothetical protein
MSDPQASERPMRILTVQQPAAGAIIALGKDVENRTWETKYRGPVAIQASAAPMPAWHPFYRNPTYRQAKASNHDSAALDVLYVLGAILAVVDLVDVHTGHPGCCASPWAERDPFPVHWMLEDIRPLEVPVAWKGGLGLRIAPADVEARLLAVTGGER